MGMYTEIRTDFTLRPGRRAVVRTLKAMAGLLTEVDFLESDANFDHEQNHPLFKCDRWGFMLTCGSAYFDTEPRAVIEQTEKGLRFQSVSNFKNYGGEVTYFADWIRSYIQPQETPFVVSIYEEFRDVQTRYFTDGRVVRHDPNPDDYRGGW